MYSIVFNFEGKRQSAGKMKKKFSFTFTVLSLFAAFFKRLTLTTNVSSLLSSFLSTNKTNLWRTKYYKTRSRTL